MHAIGTHLTGNVQDRKGDEGPNFNWKCELSNGYLYSKIGTTCAQIRGIKKVKKNLRQNFLNTLITWTLFSYIQNTTKLHLRNMYRTNNEAIT